MKNGKNEGKNNKEHPKATNALVLQGGGALGAYELGVARRLFKDPDFSPSVISGVSIGAVNATVLAGARNQKPLETLEELWRRITEIHLPLPQGPMKTLFGRMLPMFGIPDFFRPRLDYQNMAGWTSFCDVTPQQEMLEELVDFNWLNTAPEAPHLILTATNISTGNIKIFRNKKYVAGEFIPAGEHGINAKHALASGAIPPGFPPVEIDGQHYWDGGLFNNTPLSPVVESLDRHDPKATRRIFLVNLYPNVGKVPSNMLEVFSRTGELHFSDRMIFDMEMMKRVNEYVGMMTIFDKVLSQLDNQELVRKIRSLEGYKLLMSYNCIAKIVLIQTHEAEPPVPETDFSRETIDRRVSAGYRDTDLVLEQIAAQDSSLLEETALQQILNELKNVDLSQTGKNLRQNQGPLRSLIRYKKPD